MKKLLNLCLPILAILFLTLWNPSGAYAACSSSPSIPNPQFGGNGGAPFIDLARQSQEVASIIIRSGSEIDSIQICFRSGENVRCRNRHGGNGGSPSTFELAPGEFINRIRGRSGDRIDQLQFFTNRGRISPVYGGSGGSSFDVRNICLNGISGRSGSRLDALRTFSGRET